MMALAKFDFIIRDINPGEIETVADLLSTGYYHDKFFKWSVDCDDSRHRIVANYYKIYLGAAGCVSHVVESPTMGMIGASVWLPHDVDGGIYHETDKVVGEYAPQFRAVSDRSHDSEPPMAPFYQLVGFVVLREAQGMGVGGALLKYHLDILDAAGIPTYLEASTPYFGGGVYGKFGYQPVGELMVFADTAVLYPLWRPAGREKESLCPNHQNRVVSFGGHKWRVLDERDNKVLLLSEKIILPNKYHDVFENITWADSDVRKFLNSDFYSEFTEAEQKQIVETQVSNCGNPWYCLDGGGDTRDKIFLLSVQEVVRYLGGQLKSSNNKFFIDDEYNDARKATNTDNLPSRWVLRTPGNLPYLVTIVTLEGKIAMTGDFVNRSSSELFKVGVRPALWVRSI